MFTDDRLRCACDKHSTCSSALPLMYASKHETDTRHMLAPYAVSCMQPCTVLIAISVCMFYSLIPSPPSLSLSNPYSTNAGAEFVSKIDLAMQYETVQ
jgi:hypothetical protein